jgi:protein import protein ZIM17
MSQTAKSRTHVSHNDHFLRRVLHYVKFMLSLCLFRNTGLALRSLVKPHSSLPAFSVPLRPLRLGFGHSFSSASAAQASNGRPVRGAASSSTASSKESPSPTLSAPLNSSQPSTTSSHSHRLQTDPLEPRLSLTFTCTAPDCSTRSSHTFTKRAYERGVVLVQCPGCKNR